MFKALLDEGARLDCVVVIPSPRKLRSTLQSTTAIVYSALMGLCRVPELLPFLTYAVKSGKARAECLSYMFPATSGINPSLDSPLSVALYSKAVDGSRYNSGAVALLLKHGVDPNAPCEVRISNDAEVPFYAATFGKFKRVLYYPLHIVYYPAMFMRPSAPDPSPAIEQHFEWLLAAGADVNVKSYPFIIRVTPLHAAITQIRATCHAAETLPLRLIALGADVDAVRAGQQDRPIGMAAWVCNVTAFRALIAAGVDPKPRPFAEFISGHRSSSHYLMSAIQRDHHGIVAAAIDAGLKV